MHDKTYQSLPLGKHVARYLEYMKVNRDATDRTLEGYEATLGRFAAEHAHLDVTALEGAAGAQLVAAFVSRHYGGLAAGTRRKELSILSSFFSYLVRMDVLASNPVHRLDRPRKKTQRRRAHEPARIRAIIDAQPDLRDRVAISLMARLGLRKSEVRLLRWRDVDLGAGRLTVTQKGGARVDVPVVYPDMLQDLATLSVDAQRDDYLLYPVRVGNLNGQQTAIPFPDRPMQPSTMHRWWERCLAQASSSHFPMHELRHTAGTEFLRATGNLELTRKFLRHANVATTSESYMHLDDRDLVEAMQLVGSKWPPSTIE
ncbi:tyrosine recombinase XerC [soil metagenome]